MNMPYPSNVMGGSGMNQLPSGLPPGLPQGLPQQMTVPNTVESVLPAGVRPCHPKYLTPCVSAFPATSAVKARCPLLTGLVVRPFATPPSSEPAPPLVTFTDENVVRCKKCRAYINPYVKFADGGASWFCNFCPEKNEVQSSYFSSLDQFGRRHDLNVRPELTNCCIEISAPREYSTRQPMPPVYFFLLDVSINSVRSGMLRTVCSTIEQCLESLPGGTRTRVGFISFDSTVHLYTFKPPKHALEAAEAEVPGSADDELPAPAQMHVLSDLSDIFLPTPFDLEVNLHQHRAQISSFLASFADMHGKTTDPEAALGPALDACDKVMSSKGGKLLCFLSNLPSLGKGRLVNREAAAVKQGGKDLSTVVVPALLGPATDFYKEWGVRFSKVQIAVDLFLFSPAVNQPGASGYLDACTLNDLCKVTGGQLRFYPRFDGGIPSHEARLRHELARNLTRPTAWEAVMRIRASAGVKVAGIHGNYFVKVSDLMSMPAADCDKTFAAELVHDEASPGAGHLTGNGVSLQVALLYTTATGERRIRVMTTMIPVVQTLKELIDNTNTNAMVNLMSKQAVDMSLKQGLSKGREWFSQRAVAILRTYRQLAKTANVTIKDYGSLAALPLMTLGFAKNLCMRDDLALPVLTHDQRCAALLSLGSMGLVEVETLLRPRMLPIHELTGNVGLAGPASNTFGGAAEGTAHASAGPVELPQEVGLSAESLRPEGAYLVDTGTTFFLRIGRQTDPRLLDDWFGPNAIGLLLQQDQDLSKLQLRRVNGDDPRDALSPCARLTNILTFLRQVNPGAYQDLVVVVEALVGQSHAANDYRFVNCLIEDKTNTFPSLVEFAMHVSR